MNQNKVNNTWEWITRISAIAAFVMSSYTFYDSWQTKNLTLDFSAKDLVDQAWDKLGGKEGSTSLNSKMIKKSPERVILAERLLNKSIRIKPTTKAYRMKAIIFASQEKMEAALENYEKALEVESGDDYEDSTTLSNMGDTFRFKKNYEKAIEFYLNALKFDENNYIAHYGLGVVYFEQSNLRKSERSFKEVVEIEPIDIDANYYLGRIYHKQKEYDKAKAYYRKVLEVNPRDTQAKHFLNKIP